MADNISIHKLIPDTGQLSKLEAQVAHILGWQAGTVEVREVIKEFRRGTPPIHRYPMKKIDELRQVISPPQGITVTQTARSINRFPALGGK